jgi:hypothetical protein
MNNIHRLHSMRVVPVQKDELVEYTPLDIESILNDRDKSPWYFKLWYWYTRPILDTLYSEVRSWPFRIKHGFDYRDCWNLDNSVANYVLPRLKYFRSHKGAFQGYPTGLSVKKWEKIQDKMIFAFEQLVSQDYVYNKKIDKKVQEGLLLFSTYFRSLWD